MAVFHGKQGKCEFPSGTVISNIAGWTIDASCDVVDTTVMNLVAEGATVHWKDYTAIFKNWTGSFDALIDSGGLDPDLDADFAQDTDGLALEFFEGIVGETGQSDLTPRKYTGNAIITDIAMTVDKDDVAKFTYTFQGSGTLTCAAVD